MSDLLGKKCVPCEIGSGVKPVDRKAVAALLGEVPGWELSADAKTITRAFRLKNFVEAMDFINRVAALAENEGHHPDIHVFYNKVTLELSTHAIGGLSENDFILAAKINELAH